MRKNNRSFLSFSMALVLLAGLLLTACGSTAFEFRDDPDRPTTVQEVVENLRQTVQGWVDTLDAAVDRLVADAPGAIDAAADQVEEGIAGLVEEAGPVVRDVIEGVEQGVSDLVGDVIPATGGEPGEGERRVPGLPEGDFSARVDFIDVGQGAAVLVRTSQGQVALIDGGELNMGLLDYLRAAQVERIHLLVLTHPHSDHVGGLVEVLQALPVERVATNGQPHTTQVYERFLDAVDASDAQYIEVARGETLDLGDLFFQVLNPPYTGGAAFAGDLNENSLVLRLDVGQVSFLFTGDASATAEAEMLASDQPVQVEVLHLGHHGSHTSTSADFLAAARPNIAIYQAGMGNSYGHPHPSVLRALEAAQVQVYGTDTHGTIIVTTDGISYQVETAVDVREAQP